MKIQQSTPWLRAIARIVIISMVGAPMAPAQAAVTALADQPLQIQNTSKPNIVYSVDDSTSMGSDFLPDYTVIQDIDLNMWCKDGTGRGMNLRCGNQGSPGVYPFISWLPPVLAAGFNRLYYNPLILYIPPVSYDGLNHYPTMDSVKTAGWTRVYKDNWWTYLYTAAPIAAAGADRSSLTAGVSVSKWCNTEWPAGMLNSYKTTNVAPPVGEPAWFNSDYCRITGQAYPAGSGAPAVSMDYNYPRQANAAGTPDGASFFYTGTAMYCDPTKMDMTPACTANGDGVNCAASKCQTGPFAGACNGWTAYIPANCLTNPLYGPPGPCSGSECLSCGGHVCNSWNPNYYNCATPAATPINWCDPNSGSAAQKAAAARYLLEANNAASGNTCRHAMMNYTAGTNGGAANSRDQFFTAGSRGAYTTRVACAGPPNVTLPLHYYKVSVLWCDLRISSAAWTDIWRSFGNDTGANCQTTKDATHKFVKYIEYLGNYTGHTNNYPLSGGYPAFQRCDLNVGTLTATCGTTAPTAHTYWDGTSVQPLAVTEWDAPTATVIDLGTTTRTFAQEMTNYANWYAYYRTRILATKTVSSLAFKSLDTKFRVGYHTMWNLNNTFVNIADFDAAIQKPKFYDALLKKTLISAAAARQTPSLTTLTRVGEYFLNGTHASLVGSTDPINLSCQHNYHILFTDGATNEALASFPPVPAAGNVDSAAQADLPRKQPYDLNQPVRVFGKCYDSTAAAAALCYTAYPSAWPRPISEDVVSATTLADIALKYWITDLRPGGIGVTTTNNVGGWSGDPAEWQHLNFAALSLGAQGTLPGDNQAATIAAVTAGTKLWPSAVPPYKPAPNPATAIDDLWHATVNGFGGFVNAQDPQELAFGLAQLLEGTLNSKGSRSAVAIPGANLGSSGGFAYRSSFTPKWGGSLIKFPLDPVTAVIGVDVWDAAAALKTQLTPTVPHPAPWFDNRIVVTSTGVMGATGQGRPFQYLSLSGAQQTALAANAAVQPQVLQYLRGNTARDGNTVRSFRPRLAALGGPDTFLGDIGNAQPVVVGDVPKDPATLLYLPPPFYDAPGDDAGINNYWLTLQGRQRVIYAAANDGMLHAVSDIDGSELWSYIPSFLLRPATPVNDGGIASLTFQEGGNPPFFHHYMVDSTPRVADVQFDRTDPTSWHTILVGGLGKGGKGYYALDVTTPVTRPDPVTAAAELGVANNKVLWEFTDPDMGYSFGHPVIIKTRAHGWVAILTSGYNNTTGTAGNVGTGLLFFVRVRDGVLLKKMSTGSGSAGSPSGLAQVHAFVQDFHNQTAEQVYGGDLNGDFWRFDVSDPVAANWTVTKFAKLTTAGGADQPVTSAPQIEIDANNGIDRYVFIGTGRLLSDSDILNAATQVQSFYALRDGTKLQPLPAGAPITRGMLDFNNLTSIAGLGLPAVHGWVGDLAVGEHIVIDNVANINIAAFIGTSPGVDPCILGQNATIYVREFVKGYSLLGGGLASYGTAQGLTLGSSGLDLIAMFINRGGTTAEPILPPSLKLAISNATDGKMTTVDINPPAVTGTARMSWRIIGQ